MNTTESSNMLQEAASLDRLHDLSVPTEVSWWPLAPGWYGILAILVVSTLLLLWRFIVHYRSNAYRRAALRELTTLHDPTAIAELLRRTALAVASRSCLAELTGKKWLDWLATHCSEPMPESVRNDLLQGVYERNGLQADTERLKRYATHWISHHQIFPSDDGLPTC